MNISSIMIELTNHYSNLTEEDSNSFMGLTAIYCDSEFNSAVFFDRKSTPSMHHTRANLESWSSKETTYIIDLELAQILLSKSREILGSIGLTSSSSLIRKVAEQRLRQGIHI